MHYFEMSVVLPPPPPHTHTQKEGNPPKNHLKLNISILFEYTIKTHTQLTPTGLSARSFI